jgi:pimeloyl-ACP methyl ester carboxylesterase
MAYALSLFVLQRAMIFGGKRRGPIPAAPPPVFELAARIALQTPSGRVDALYMPPRRAPDAGAKAPAILFAHGNAELIEQFPEWFEAVRPPDVAVLLVEFPGYGWSEGEPTASSVREALAVAHDWLSARPEIDRTRIIGYGRSLGGAAMCTLVGHRPLAALILSSTFTSLRPFAWRMLAPPVLLRDAFDNLAAVKRFEGPVLIVHGSIDELIPYEQGQALAAATKRATLVTYRAGHNDCPPDAAQFARDLKAGLDEHALIAAP